MTKIIPRREKKIAGLLLAGYLSLFFSLFTTDAFAEIRQWDFDNAEDYQFSDTQIQVQNGNASLVPVSSYRDAGSQSFDKGRFLLNTSSARGTLELDFSPLQENSGIEIPLPVSNREPGLTALWHFDEPNGTNLLDVAGRNVAKGSDSEIVSGQTGFGYARAFDGEKSYVFIPHYQTLNFDGAFSVEMWIRPVAVSSSKPQTLFSRWQTVGVQRSFALQISTEGKLDFLVSPDGAVTTHHLAETKLAEGVWYHVAAVYNGKDLRVYLNGALDGAPTPFAAGIHAGTNPIYLGALVDNRLDQFYKGVMDEVAFYDRALTETEALTHFGNPRGITGLWHFNERGGVLADASGYGHNATVSGDVQYEAEGRMGAGLHFDGKGDFVQVPASTRLAPQGELTLEAWIKPEQLPGFGQSAAIISLYEDNGSAPSGGGEVSLVLAGPDGRVAAYAPRLQPSELKGKMPLIPGVWQHVAVTWARGKVSIYNNGVLDASAPYTGSLEFSKMAARIGNDSKSTASFKGFIDEPSIYRRAGSGPETAARAGLFYPSGIYLSETKDAGSASPWRSMAWQLPMPYALESGSETGLIHAYAFNDAEGASIADSRGEIAASPIGTYPVPGIFGKARWFAAKGYDKILSQKDFPSLSTFSAGLWFEFAESEPGLTDRLFSIGDGNPTVFRGADGRIHVQMQGAREIVGERVLKDTEWHHLMLTADGRNLFLYVDGLLDGNSPFVTATAKNPLVLGNLKSTDTFRGAMDEFLFYNYPFSRDQVMSQYLKGRMDAKVLVRSSDEPDFANALWRGPRGPHMAEQPGTFTAALWHFDEPYFRGLGSEAADAGRFANHATAYGKPGSFSAGVTGRAVRLNGASDFLRVPDAQSIRPENFTLSLWVRPERISEGETTILDKQLKAGAPVFSSFALELVSGNRLAFRAGRPGGYQQIESGREGEVAVGRWNHVAAVYNGREIRLYVQGKLVKTAPFRESIPYDAGALYFGRYGSGESRYFQGSLDEVHVLNTAASDQEVEALFLKADPENAFRPFETVETGLQAARYFQYQIELSTEAPFASPAVSAVEVKGNAFRSDRPAISTKNGISYADITSFSEKPGRENRGAISYQLSPDGANWFYHNGRHWVVASGAAESNTAAQLQSRIREFPKEAGIGSFYFRAFLYSPTGVEQAELDAVTVEYLPNKLTLTAPNGGEALLAGTDQVIRWNSAGEVQKVTLEYSKDDFRSDFHEIAKNIPNSGSYEWKVPDDLSVSVKVRVLDSLDPRIYDSSDLTFRTTGKLEMQSPNWDERWEVGSTHDVLWKTSGPIPQVKLEYSTDNFEKNIFTMVDSLKNEGRWSWKIPDHVSSEARVRVSDVRDPQVSDKSNDSFAIIARLTLMAPAQGARWITGSQQEIRWQSIGTVPLVNLDYRTSQKPEWVRIAENFESRGSYFWQVPDDIDDQVFIRLSDAADEEVFTEAGPFIIHGGLRLLAPKGGEQWTAGSRHKIAWQSIGTIPAVDVQYKTDPAGEWLDIESGMANTGSYVWEVPSTITGPLMVRVMDSRDTLVSAEHSSASEVIAGFDLKSPNGGEEWKTGSVQSIQWDTAGRADVVRLEYSKDNFKSDIHEIIAEASNLGTFAWTVPGDVSTEVRIRISDARNPAAHEISEAPFRIYGGFEMEIPKGGEKFEVGSMATLTWQTLGDIPNVKLEYSRDDFNKDFRLIENSIPNNGRYTWSVPDDMGAGYQLHISDVADPKTEAFSSGKFGIIGNFRLLFPTGGENLIAGTIAKVRWKGAGSVPVVRIDYSEDEFEKSFNTITDSAPNNGVYDWMVPNLIGRQFKIRIWDPSQPDSIDVMSQPARIVGGFRLLSPNGGEVLYVGDRAPVEWETSGTIGRIKIEFSSDNFTRAVSTISDAQPNNGRYDWLVPDAPAGKYRVRISDPHDAMAYDISNGDFFIRSHFTVLEPNGGEGWPVGQTRSIRWQTSASVSQVRLEYSRDDFKTAVLIDKAAANTGSYEWQVPDDVDQNVRVRVSDVLDSEANDTSDKPFRIQGVLRLTSPVGGEIWKVGEQRTVTWQTSGAVPGVRLEYSRDGFVSEAKVITESTPNAGYYNWTVPDDAGTQTRLRVMDVRDYEAADASAKPFEITGSFALLAPNGGESWHAGEKREIVWRTVGTVREVNLDYSRDDFKSEPVSIDRSVLNAGRFMWEVPAGLGEGYKLRVCDAESPNACDISDNGFAVRTPIEITAPSGGGLWTVGSEQEIRWNTYGNIPRVIVSYSVKEGEWKKLVEELPNQGYFLFKTPDDIAKNVYFRVSSYEDESLFDTARPVTVIGSFSLLRPNGGEKWAAGTTQKISWDTLGTVANARLEYSVDEFKNDIQLIESSYTNTGSYTWAVPERTGITMKVRISDAAHSEAYDVSDNVFKIMPGVFLTTPNGGEKWTAKHKEKITWKTAGKTDWIRLEYRLAGASAPAPAAPAVSADAAVSSTPAPALPAPPAWTLITDRAPNSGEYEWELPAMNGREFLVRASDALDPDAFDISENFFEIKPEILLTRPVGGEIALVGSETELLWDTVGKISQVRIEYSTDGFQKDIRPIADKIPNTGKFLWRAPDHITSDARVRVTSVEDALVSAVSPSPFKIIPAFEVLEPAGIEKWTVGTEQVLKWNWRGTLETVKLEYSLNDFVSSTDIASAAPNSGSYRWKIPDLAHSKLKIRVSDPAHPEASAVSPSFGIIPGFKMLSPDGGEKLRAGERRVIEWETAGTSSKVRLEYGISSADTYVWKPIEGVIRNQGRFEWLVPDDLSSKAKIRVTDALESLAADESDAPFKMLGVLDILAPRPDELLRVDDRYQIRWETRGKVASVRLEYSASPENESSFKPIENFWANSGKYFWTVPDAAAEKIWIRISDASEPDTFVISREPFKIRGALELQLPEGAGPLQWPVGSVQTLQWKTTGTIPRVNLEYSTDHKTWKTAAEKISNTGSYGWTVPDDTAQGVKLRVSDSEHPIISDESERPVTIAAQFAIQTPEAGASWAVGSRQTLRWKTTGKVQKLYLEFMTDGKKWLPLAGPMSDTGSVDWEVPDRISSEVKIRIRDGDNSEAFALSAPFAITGALEIKSPVGAEVWEVGSRQKIQWATQGTMPKVRLEALLESGDGSVSAPVVLAESLDNKGSFEWTVPDTISDALKIRVLDVRDPAVSAVSPKTFSVIARFEITSPKKEDVWTVASAHEIAWSTKGTVPSVQLEYSRDDFYRETSLISSDTPNTGAALWTVPDAIGNNLKVRIADTRDPRTAAVSEAFAVRGALEFEAPAPGVLWKVGSLQRIEWRTTGTIPSIRLEYSRDDFHRDIQVIENVRENTGSVEWKVPDAISSTLKLRIMNESDASVQAVSPLIKVAGILALKSPAGGEKFPVLSSQKISWATTGSIPNVRIEYSKDDFNKDLHIITGEVRNEGSFDWIVPDDVTDSMKIRIMDTRDFSVSSVSPEPVSVRGTLAMTTQTQGQRWAVGSEQELTWETVGTIPFVRVEYSKDDFQKDVHLVAENVPNRGKVYWTVPDDISNNIRLRVLDPEHADVFALSTDPAAVTGRFAWTAPSGGQTLLVGDTSVIKWSTQGTIPAVRLEYASAGSESGSWNLITGALENKGEFSWVVPDFITGSSVLRVSDLRDALTTETSPAFSIMGQLSVMVPGGGERWIVGSSHDLVWSTSGSISMVWVEYSRDNFKKDIQSVSAQALPNNGRVQWTVPDAISGSMQIRVRDAEHANVMAQSRLFTVMGDLKFISPAGAAVWQTGTPQKIQWQTLGSIPRVRLEYIEADGKAGEEHGAMIAPELENSGSFIWNIPAEAPARLKLRLTNVEDATVFEETQEPVQVLGLMEFVSPVMKQSWEVGSTQEIVWKTRGFVSNVKLEYSRDGFQKDIQTMYPLLPNTGSVKWEVPDIISPEVRLRVTDADHPKVFTVTPAPVLVRGGLKITAPVSSSEIQAGEKLEINWMSMGTLPFVRLEYSRDGFTSSPEIIAEKIRNTGQYFWEVPALAGQKLAVRVVDTENPEVFSVAGQLGVHGRLELVSPRGGEIWKAGENVQILWNTLGGIPAVNLDYSSDEFAVPNAIASRAANQGAYTWRVPSNITQPVKIRVADPDDSQVYAVTPIPVKIQGVFTLLSPQGGEFWTTGSEQTLLWQTEGTIPFVSVEYSTDNFNTAVPVLLGVANEGRLGWTVPDLMSDSLRFRVLDARDQSVAAVSNPVRVGGRLQLTNPAGGEILRVGQDAEIRWKTTGTVPRIKIELSGDGFKNDVRTLSQAAPNTGVFEWKVPDSIQSGLQVRISDVNHSDIYDVSRGVFKIAGALKITSPSAGDTWPVSSRKSLEWQTTGTIPFVRVEYSKDAFRTAIPVDLHLKNTGKLEWMVPDFSGADLQFRVSDAADAAVFDTTGFSIPVRGGLALTAPMGEEVWPAHSQQAITWTTIGTIPNVSLQYTSEASREPVRIADSIANSGSFVWNVPDRSLRIVKVRVSDSRFPSIYTESGPFEIQGGLELTSPQGGEVWIAGTEHPITWNTTGTVEKVRLDYSIDNFTTIVPVAMAVPNEGKFMWRVSDAVSRSVRIRVSDASGNGVMAESRGAFEVRGALALLNPAGGEDWAVGSRHAISWETTGTIPQVRLDYSTDDFRSDVQMIAPVITNRGLYEWEIPSMAAQQFKVRVSDVNNQDIFDISGNPVRVAGGLELTAPVTGETFRVGEKTEIRWRGTPNIANVKLEYSSDDFKTTRLISNYVPNTGSFEWNIPDEISENLKIRVSDAANAVVSAYSPVPFRILGAFNFRSPKGDEVWTVGSRQTLAWETLGSISRVRLEYSGDEFRTSVPIAASIDNQGRYEWSVPEVTQPEIQFRISDASTSSVYAISPGKIHVAGKLEFVTPVGGERWIVGEERVIRWRTLGFMSKVDLEYSKDGFFKDVHLIVSAAPNVGSYSWKIPHDLGKEIRIRIRNSEDARIFTVTEVPFQIDYNRITWTVRDSDTNEHLLGLTLTDSAGKTQSSLSSPMVLEYPYGIYTAVWSKPGYQPFKSTWLADKDMNFTVTLQKEREVRSLEAVRFNFQYDRGRDLMNIQSWYEKDGAAVPAVVQSEVRIYKGTQLIKTLVSSTPDTEGYFHMVWDTRSTQGDARYVASASITMADGHSFTSPVSYQLDIPVKEVREPVVRQSVSSIYLKPVGIPAVPPPSAETLAAPVAMPSAEVEPTQPAVKPAPAVSGEVLKTEAPSASEVRTREPQLISPSSAVMGETVSITYMTGENARPVLDLYDANRRLALRAQALRSEGQGKFVYLMPVKGVAFIPGKTVTVSVVDLATGRFSSSQMMIQTSAAAAGLDQTAGAASAQNALLRLDEVQADIRVLQKDWSQMEELLPRLENRLGSVAEILLTGKLPETVMEKLNEVSGLLAQLLESKGYAARFLTEQPLSPEATTEDVLRTLDHYRDALEMVRKVYYYSNYSK